MNRMLDARRVFALGTALPFVLCAQAASAQDAPAQDAPAEDTLRSVLVDGNVTNDPDDADTLIAGSVDVQPPPPQADLPVVEPIIEDEEFNAAIPSLDAPDPELDALGPLESIAEFERRFAEQQAADEGAAEGLPAGDIAAPGRLPELADGDAVEEIADAPIRDAELTTPLSPLEDFEVREFEFAEAASDEEILSVDYVIQLNGLDDVEAETETDLAGLFDSLSALEDADGEAANVAMLSARVEEDAKLLASILKSEGYYDAAVTTRIDRSVEDNGQPLTAILDIAPGERFTFSQIDIEAGPTVPPTLIEDNFAIETGEPIIAARVQGAEAQVAIALPEQGYPFVVVGQRDILLDQETGDGVYTLPIDTGPRARFGGFTTSGDTAFDADHVDVLARFERGELFDSRLVDDLRQAMVATGLLSQVTVVPERTGEDAGDGTEYVNIAVTQQAGPPRTIAGSAGFGTGQGFRLEGSWSHRNLFPPEGALTASAVLGTQEQGAGLTFRRANAGRRDRTVEFGINALRARYDAFNALTGRIGGLVSYASTPIWQKRFTYAFGGEILGSIEEDFDFATGENIDRTYFIGALTGQVGFDTSNSLLNPTEGFRLRLFVQPEGSFQDSFSPYVRSIVDGSAYLPFGDSIVLAGRVRGGTIAGTSRQNIAPSRRFYAGGGGSVRGFGFQQLGPQVLEPNPNFDPEDIDPEDPDAGPDPFRLRPIGGRSVIEGAVEVRYRFGNFGVVGFVDAGQVYESSTPGFDDIRYGVGVGGRYYTNFGPMRVDIATPLGRRDGESAFNIYVSIGQAF